MMNLNKIQQGLQNKNWIYDCNGVRLFKGDNVVYSQRYGGGINKLLFQTVLDFYNGKVRLSNKKLVNAEGILCVNKLFSSEQIDLKYKDFLDSIQEEKQKKKEKVKNKISYRFLFVKYRNKITNEFGVTFIFIQSKIGKTISYNYMLDQYNKICQKYSDYEFLVCNNNFDFVQLSKSNIKNCFYQTFSIKNQSYKLLDIKKNILFNQRHIGECFLNWYYNKELIFFKYLNNISNIYLEKDSKYYQNKIINYKLYFSTDLNNFFKNQHQLDIYKKIYHMYFYQIKSYSQYQKQLKNKDFIFFLFCINSYRFDQKFHLSYTNVDNYYQFLSQKLFN